MKDGPRHSYRSDRAPCPTCGGTGRAFPKDGSGYSIECPDCFGHLAPHLVQMRRGPDGPSARHPALPSSYLDG